MIFGIGDKVKYKTGGLTGTVINVLWSGKYYVEWADGCFNMVCCGDLELVK